MYFVKTAVFLGFLLVSSISASSEAEAEICHEGDSICSGTPEALLQSDDDSGLQLLQVQASAALERPSFGPSFALPPTARKTRQRPNTRTSQRGLLGIPGGPAPSREENCQKSKHNDPSVKIYGIQIPVIDVSPASLMQDAGARVRCHLITSEMMQNGSPEIELCNARVSLYDDTTCQKQRTTFGAMSGDDCSVNVIGPHMDPWTPYTQMNHYRSYTRPRLLNGFQGINRYSHRARSFSIDFSTHPCMSSSSMLQEEETQAAQSSGVLEKARAKLPITEKAYIENSAVLGDGAGHTNFYACMELADHMVKNPLAPSVKVCGVHIKMTVYLLGRCGAGSLVAANMAHTWEIGTCDTWQPPSQCVSYSPSADVRMGVAQSYKITHCE